METTKEVFRGQKAHDTVSFIMEECCACGIPFFMPVYYQKKLVENHTAFFCPNGHRQSYNGKNEAEKLRDELAKVKLDKFKREEELQNKFLDELNRSMLLEKKLKRVHNGVCPCCNRSFTNLKRHIATKHPELIKKS